MSEGDIYNIDQRIKASIRRLNNDENILKSNKNLILEFHNDLKLEDASKKTQNLYIQRLSKISRLASEPFEKMDKSDIKEILGKIFYIQRQISCGRHKGQV